MKRYALITSARTRREAEAYLPDNYRVIHETSEAHWPARTGPTFVIQGEDRAGWTLDSYVIPRYASGLIQCQEIDLSHPIMREVPYEAILGEYEVRVVFPDGHAETRYIDAATAEDAEAIAVKDEPSGAVPHAYRKDAE